MRIRRLPGMALLVAACGVASFAAARTGRAQEQGGTVVAVFEIEDTRPQKARLSDRERADLTVYLGAILAEDGTYRVVPPEQLKKALLDKKRESYRECFDERCQIEIGREVAAQKTLATRIMQVGQQCGIIATLYDLRQAASEKATTYKGACGKDALFTGLEFLAKKLRGAGPAEKVADPAAAARHYQEGLAALEKNDLPAAEKSFAEAEKAGFSDWKLENDLYHQWGELYRARKKDPAKAAEMFHRCVEVSQDKTEWPAYWCVYLQGLQAYEQGKSQPAIEHFERALSFMKGASFAYQNDVYHMLGETYRVLLHDPAKAAEFHQKTVEVSQDKSDWPAFWSEYLLGVLAYENNQPDRAIALYQQALLFAPDMSWNLKNDIYHMLGEVYRNPKGDPAKAAEFFKKAVEVSQDKSEWPAFWSEYILGVLAYEQNQPDEVIALLKQALLFAPNMDWNLANDIYHLLGETYRLKKNDQAKAAEFHQKAVEVSQDKSEWPAFWSEYILGVLAHEQNQPDRAITSFQQALAFAPGMSWNLKNDIFHMLGETCRNQKNDPARAAEFHQKAWDVSEDKSDWPAFWSRYILGLMAYQQGNADRAIALCKEAQTAMDRASWFPPDLPRWRLQNDVLYVLGEVYRTQKKDPVRAAGYHQRAWDVSEDKADWPGFWSRYILGVMAFDQGNAEGALSHFTGLREVLPRIAWYFQNDVFYYWGETFRYLKKDPTSAGPFYAECLKASQDLADWPAYWCLLRQAELARDTGRKGEAAEMMLRAEAAGKADEAFQKEIDRIMRASGMR
ncbi:MAG: tetratricopeptide repeat protein [Myxococcales bacterium]|nr:tetratricopeptide repeat protein [Myxococcales bacterium]